MRQWQTDGQVREQARARASGLVPRGTERHRCSESCGNTALRSVETDVETDTSLRHRAVLRLIMVSPARARARGWTEEARCGPSRREAGFPRYISFENIPGFISGHTRPRVTSAAHVFSTARGARRANYLAMIYTAACCIDVRCCALGLAVFYAALYANRAAPVRTCSETRIQPRCFSESLHRFSQASSKKLFFQHHLIRPQHSRCLLLSQTIHPTRVESHFAFSAHQ